MHRAGRVRIAQQVLRVAAISLAAVALTLGVAACGGKSAGHPTVPHATSSPARALMGHWKDNLGMDQYFNGKEWFTRSPGGDTWSYHYDVISQDVAKRTVKTNTYLLEDGSKVDVQEVTFTFSNRACTKLRWDMATGPSAIYVDGQTQP